MSLSAASHLSLPRALAPGDTLGVIAPASPFDRTAFDSGIQVLASMGFKLVVPKEIYATDGFLAGSDRLRADMIHRMFADPAIHGIVCARGGYGAMRILPLLDTDLIKARPKVVVGFSDITVLLTVLVQHCHMVAFHGPTVTTLGNAASETLDAFRLALTDPSPVSIAADTGQVIWPGQASGPFLCGNLTLFCHLMGTPFEPDFNDAVLLIEDQGEAPYRIDRMLTQMRLAGCFDRLAGLALGNFNNCGSVEAVNRIVDERLGDLKIPIMAGFPVGHEGGNMTLPVGVAVQLDTVTGRLTSIAAALS